MNVHEVRKIVNAFEVLKTYCPTVVPFAGKEVYATLHNYFCGEQVLDVNTQMKNEFPFVTVNNKVSAIKRYRELTGTSLFDAKNWVETHLPSTI